MKARDQYYSRADRFSLGVDDESGRPYVSFPVTASSAEYEEYYELTPAQYADYLAEPATALDFVNECRRREHDDLLMQKPGWNRGIPWW